MATVCKRFKSEEDYEDSSQNEIYILPQKIQRRRYEILVEKAREKKLPVNQSFRAASVSHVVSELDSVDGTLQMLHCVRSDLETKAEFVRSTWLSECIKAGYVLPVLPCHRLPGCDTVRQQSVQSMSESTAIAEYACQRVTLLNHHNLKFTKALNILEEFADMKGDEANYSRALAFRRAAATLASLPRQITKPSDLAGLPDIGDHSKRIIENILENGISKEVIAVENDDWFQKMKQFTSVFGVGPATAKKWIKNGISSIDAAIADADLLAATDQRIAFGLRYFADLSCPVTKPEADSIHELVATELTQFAPGISVELVGGFRRGKQMGHDIDLLLTHPEEGGEREILPQLVSILESRNLVLHGRYEKSTDVSNDEFLLASKGTYLKSTLDHFEKWIGILKVPRNIESGNMDPSKALSGKADSDSTISEVGVVERSWRACRVDLVVCPFSQYHYALVGWTGSKHFNRSLRLFAQRRLSLRLTSHGLYDSAARCSIPAASEQEVFLKLGLPYRQPFERNC